MTIVIVVVLFGFGLYRYSSGDTIHGYVDFTVAVVISSAIYFLKKNRGYYTFFSRLYISLGFIMAMLNLSYLDGNYTKGVWWSFLIVLTYFLRDKKEGLLWNLSFIATLIILNSLEIGFQLSFVDILTLIVNFLLISSILYLYEIIKEKEESIVQKNKEKDQIIFQQNKMIAMGEIVAFIAHQWRQPLMELSTVLMELEAKLSLKKEVNKEEVLETIEESNTVMNFMSSTIDDFQNFFSTQKNLSCFSLQKVINTSVAMVRSVFKHYGIEHKVINNLADDSYYGSSNELAQVVLNILINSKDQFASKRAEDPKIIVILDEDEKNINITFEDNGGGIETEVLDRVFEPFVTTKDERGNGMGLFLSKKIIEESFKGSLSVQNVQKNVARFKISLPKGTLN